QRALEELRQMEFQGDHGEIFSISFSAGIANYPDENTNIDDLLKIADEKLYKAKQAGRNCIIA
ncbi:MAG TPA: diguanylate cyclase, partial [Candidatus Obscuribacter sp.]|nr:diguanylate cyclase [Candidatus Obscuribacter sp.]